MNAVDDLWQILGIVQIRKLEAEDLGKADVSRELEKVVDVVRVPEARARSLHKERGVRRYIGSCQLLCLCNVA